jgi:hypothetical protein
VKMKCNSKRFHRLIITVTDTGERWICSYAVGVGYTVFSSRVEMNLLFGLGFQNLK